MLGDLWWGGRVMAEKVLMMEIISSVFFVGMRPAPARRVRAAGGHVAIQQLLTSSSNCMSFQVQEVGQQGVAAADTAAGSWDRK